MKNIVLGAAIVALVLGGVALAASVPDYVTKAVSDTMRPKADSDRDALRLPAETIAFAGVKPGMKVAELFPGGGYFTRMLSDVVGPNGHIYGIENAKWDDGSDAKVAAEPGHANVSIQIVKFGEFDLPQKVDLFWITQNYHDLHNLPGIDVVAFNRLMLRSLKPGGIYVVLDHAAPAGSGVANTNDLHRIDPAAVRKEVEAAGFVFAGESKVLANPADPHTAKVFDPAVRGHTDQFVYKFRKPR